MGRLPQPRLLSDQPFVEKLAELHSFGCDRPSRRPQASEFVEGRLGISFRGESVLSGARGGTRTRMTVSSPRGLSRWDRSFLVSLRPASSANSATVVRSRPAGYVAFLVVPGNPVHLLCTLCAHRIRLVLE